MKGDGPFVVGDQDDWAEAWVVEVTPKTNILHDTLGLTVVETGEEIIVECQEEDMGVVIATVIEVIEVSVRVVGDIEGGTAIALVEEENEVASVADGVATGVVSVEDRVIGEDMEGLDSVVASVMVNLVILEVRLVHRPVRRPVRRVVLMAEGIKTATAVERIVSRLLGRVQRLGLFLQRQMVRNREVDMTIVDGSMMNEEVIEIIIVIVIETMIEREKDEAVIGGTMTRVEVEIMMIEPETAVIAVPNAGGINPLQPQG